MRAAALVQPGTVAGDIGFMFMVDKELTARLLVKFLPDSPDKGSTVLMMLLAGCIAWCPYCCLSLGPGAGGKAAVRVIQTVSLPN